MLLDDDGCRANMTASWLAQMAWEVYVLDQLEDEDLSESGPYPRKLPALPENIQLTAAQLHELLQSNDVVIVDVARHVVYKEGHIPGAWYVLRSRLADAAARLPRVARYVVTSDEGLLAQFVAPELAQQVDAEVYVLAGGTQAWSRDGYKMETGESHLACKPVDRYQRPYEGTNASPEAMQAYLDWEFGLIEQLQRDGAHHFKPLAAPGS